MSRSKESILVALSLFLRYNSYNLQEGMKRPILTRLNASAAVSAEFPAGRKQYPWWSVRR